MRFFIPVLLVLGLTAWTVLGQNLHCASSADCENKGTECNQAFGFKHIQQDMVLAMRDHCFKNDGSDGERLFCCDEDAVEAGIIGMYGAKEGDYPYIAFISSEAGNCGAAVYNEEYLITAAHCVKNEFGVTDKVKVIVAAVIENDMQFGVMNPEKVYYSSGENVMVHEDYVHGASPILNDIAVLKLNSRISKKIMGSRVKSIRFPKVNETPGKAPKDSSGKTQLRAIGIGYGKSDLNATLGVLMGGKLPLSFIGDKDCNGTAGTNDQVLCIGGKGYGSVSSGDSGSPGVCLDSKNMPYHCGIASYVKGNCVTQLGGECPQIPPGAFVNTAHPDMNKWIKEKLGGAKQKPNQLLKKLKNGMYEGKMIGSHADYDDGLRQKILQKHARKNRNRS